MADQLTNTASLVEMLPNISRAMQGLTPDQSRMIYPQIFHWFAKQSMWNLHLIFSGKVEVYDVKGEEESHDMYLPYRLSSEQIDRAREAFCILWDIISHKELESTPISAARTDAEFQKVLCSTSKAPRRRGRRKP